MVNNLNAKFKKVSNEQPVVIKSNEPVVTQANPVIVKSLGQPIKLIGQNTGSFVTQNPGSFVGQNNGSFVIQKTTQPTYIYKGSKSTRIRSTDEENKHIVYGNNLITKHGGNK